jgi:Zn2+/Cd2+-exporting ATPase
MTDACCGGDACATPEASSLNEASGQRWQGPDAWVLLSGVFIVTGALAGWLMSPLAGVAAYVLAILCAIGPPARRAVRALGSRSLDINVLMVIAVGGAAALGDWQEAAIVVWLFALAQWIETRSLGRARHAIRSLMALAPSEALVRRHGREQRVPAADVRIGDVVIVRPGERVPVDGRVVAGESAVDQAPITGESWPVVKEPGGAVFAGSINGTGALEIEAARRASDSTLSRIIHMVERAQAQRAPIQTFVDRFARRYTPAVVTLAVLVAVVPPTVAFVTQGTTASFPVWVYRALTLLVVACPCALVISTPVAVASALTAAARTGLLIKGGAHLERLASIRCLAFDKTGTLTHGRVTVTDVVGVEGTPTDGVLAVAAALESRSEHPIGRAIVDRARAGGIDVIPGEGYRALPGLGAEARVAEAEAIVGSHRLFEERRLCTPALHAHMEAVEGRGARPVFVGRDGVALGVIGLADEMRGGGREAASRLRRQGVDRLVLLTGDSHANAAGVVDAVGLDEAHADLMPEDKVAMVGRLRERYGPVAMVGDGVNDAAVLAGADVAIALAEGAALAQASASIVLAGADLGRLPALFATARRARRLMRQNLAWAAAYNAVALPLAAAALVPPWLAALGMTASSLVVTLNALRLARPKASPGADAAHRDRLAGAHA